ncbi:phage portal protein [Sphingobacterium corticibacter]|uniref:Phage portal protein n=1 Tax=Sphingobacterium corticibacter TaxID=2171749 RepID=A0A2T8HNK7_9SPHI|nr:phage portal protein [Sphingobacterium corticibacter]PVH26993.1 hypothetical protein DC487_05200 [Sphingobacterium corticibacter]
MKETKKTQEQITPTLIEEMGKKAAPTYEVKPEISPDDHAIHDEQKRKKKAIVKKVLGADGKPVMMADGVTPATQTTYIDPARLSLSLQDIIVTRRVAFMNLGKVKLFAEPDNTGEERAFSLLQRLRENNKVAFKESEIANIMNRELQAAKLWYSVDTIDATHWGGYSAVKKNFKVQVLAPSKGDTLLPVFDNHGDLIYFGRGYEIDAQAGGENGGASAGGSEQKTKCLDVYTIEKLYRFQQGAAAGSGSGTGEGWALIDTVELPYGKIPVIYYSRERPIWANVQPLIERLETVISNFADTNDYHASPTLVFKGATGAQAQEKGESGKAVLLTGEHADAKYVTWDQSVDAVKLEIDTLVNFIYSLTQTPNISFEEMKALGNLSGVAFDRVFIDAHLASRREIEGGYGELIQRGINLEKALLASMDTSVSGAMQSLSVTFEAPHFQLEDLDADVTLAIKAKDGGLISVETAMGISGLVTNVQDEMDRMKGEVPAEVKE